jgi:energy-coupling factor transporter ATP-binding protein EcfA2
VKAVRFDSVHYSYPQEKHGVSGGKIFNGLNLELFPGRIYVMSGPNGCGKSTFARLMAGIICPDEGRVLIDGKNIRGVSLPEVGKAVGFVMQDPSRQLITQKPAEEIAFGLIHRGVNKAAALAMANAALKEYGLSDAAATYTQRLSKGEQVRLAMASVAALNPDWLVLDESLSSLDPSSRGIVIEKVREMKGQGRGVLIVSHSKVLGNELSATRILMERGGNALVG